ncbi:fimbrial biogenesis outer membrane usher protein [Escherichia fergusonii]|uniref:fimbria/pilus outer membrane usher protein n=1 Tax=Escherichia fergusonii TaxID=564 RepID=UPI001CC0A1E0|nr:fimbria/pilus outer membrane usher protein [Escherichia fergusonii]MBZ4135456.1 fimbrial biogenesis outer membrane usher protein [Escherichia fergusonii]MBZ4171564.1 fimbrial biogenesis outer membrane usher protein [Escherichia fergusonii]UAW40622.1 fimbrial biogenesis outer membrane usher protein [Escherichia fergusonii]
MAVSAHQVRGVVMILIITSSVPERGMADDDLLPPPPNAHALEQQAIFHLALVINYYDTQQVVPVTQRNGDFYLSRADLMRAGLPAEQLPVGEVNVSRLTHVNAEYDSSGQRLLLTVPRNWLPERITPFAGEAEPQTAHHGSGVLLNYDFYNSKTQNGSGQATLSHELRFFNDAGSLSSTGFWRQRLSGADDLQEGYVRYDTTFTATNEQQATQWRVGDVISDALSWSSSVRLGGVYWGRDFSLRPDLVTWPLPTFSGEAAVPTAVDLFINGYRAGSTSLQPGPFTLTNLPYINGAGDAVLVTQDAAGRQVTTSLPFYVASNLLKPGMSDGALSFGALRREYGIDSFNYGPAAASASYRYGVSDFLTLEGHSEVAEELALGGAGAVVKLGYFGVVNGAYSESRMHGRSGNQINWGYQYSTAAFSVATQHTRRERGFGNLALYDNVVQVDENNVPLATLSQQSDQYSLSFNMGELGNVGAAWIGVRSFDAQKTELLNLSWSRNLWGSSSVYLAASRDWQQGGWTVAMSVQIPLGERDSAAFTMEKMPDAGQTQRINYNHSMPTDGGFSWNLAWARQSEASNYKQATLGWRNDHLELQGGTWGESGNMTWWGEALGAFVWMEQQLFAANKINDAFVVVSTDGQAGVPVNYENQPVGETNRDGYLLISGVSAYYPASYSINTLNLPADIRLKETERKVALRRQSGYLVDFPMDQQQVASVILHDEKGQILPVGSEILLNNQTSAVVGYDGIVWLENLAPVNLLHAITPDGKQCQTRLSLTPNPQHKLKTYGPLVCRSGS